MSDQPGRPRDPSPDRNPAVAVFLIFFGIILLLPVVCSIIFSPGLFSGGGVGEDSLSQALFVVWLAGALIGLGGVAVVIFAIRRLFASRR
jgi:hypothetical protein